MSVTDLEMYGSWLFGSKQNLEVHVKEIDFIASETGRILLGKEKESERMTLIRAILIKSGNEADPGAFMAKSAKTVEKYRSVLATWSLFSKWLKEIGGVLEWDFLTL
jgi:hypothetical protein